MTKGDRAIAKQSLREERKAVSDYEAREERAESPRLKTALSHAREEEKEHAKGFSASMKYGMHHEVRPVIAKAKVLASHGGKDPAAVKPGVATHTFRWGIAHDGATSRGVSKGGPAPLVKAVTDYYNREAAKSFGQGGL